MGNLTKKQAEEGARDFEKERTGERDSSKEFARAGHQAREDAVGTDFEVRPAKGTETESSSKSDTDSSSDNNSDSSSENSDSSSDNSE
jgi:hypothetical protein